MIALHSTSLLSHSVPHAFSTRQGGISGGLFSSLNFGNPSDLPTHERDPAANIHANFARLTASGLGASAGPTPRRIVEVHQVHGAAALILRRGDSTPAHSGTTVKADVIVTDDPSTLACIRVADCAPVLLASNDGRVVAAVHAGWRGCVAGAARVAVEAMTTLGARPEEITAAIGPCISAAHFEVGEEVAAEFERAFPHDHAAIIDRSRPKPHIDLKAALAAQLRRAGLPAAQIDTLPHCSVSQPHLFFSHRRDQGKTGRMVGIIGPRA